MVKCKKHPKYKGIKEPRKTKKHPLGCSDCWRIYMDKHPKEETVGFGSLGSVYNWI